MRRSTHEFAPVGQGNVVSIEFNILYRWHATLSASDTKWMEGLFAKLFPSKDVNTVCCAHSSFESWTLIPSQLEAKDLKDAMHSSVKANPNVKAWTFNE